MSNTVNIPISFLRRIRSKNHAIAFITLKCAGEARIAVDDCIYSKRIMNRLVALKWVRTDGKYYFLVAWKKIDQMYRGKSHCIRYKVDQLLKNLWEEIYTSVHVWHVRIQPNRPLPASQKRLGRLQFGENSGGVSLSLMARFFDKSIGWASYMRRRCEKVGVCSWKRRYAVVNNQEEVFWRLCDDEHRSGLFFADGKWRKEVSSVGFPLHFYRFGYL